MNQQSNLSDTKQLQVFLAERVQTTNQVINQLRGNFGQKEYKENVLIDILDAILNISVQFLNEV